MAGEMYNGGGGDPVPVKTSKKKRGGGSGVDDCTSGACAPKTRGMRSFSRFSPTKKRYGIPSGGKKKPEPEPTGGAHMNVRDLGGEPGNPSYNKQQNYSYAGDTEKEATKKREVTLTKNRRFFKR